MKGWLAATTITIAHGLVGWGLCGATMGLATAATTLENALIIHAIAAPAIFIAVSFVYFRQFGSESPLKTAAQFLGVVATARATAVYFDTLCIRDPLYTLGSGID
jgi:hypothetical protein